jgi:hypothetical protein
MRNGSKCIPSIIPRSVCEPACTDRIGEGPTDVTSNAHSASVTASRKRERAWNRECNCQCDCGELHGLSPLFLDRETTSPFVLSFLKFFFKRDRSRQSCSHLAEPQCSSNRLPSRVIWRQWLLDFARSPERFAILSMNEDSPSPRQYVHLWTERILKPGHL